MCDIHINGLATAKWLPAIYYHSTTNFSANPITASTSLISAKWPFHTSSSSILQVLVQKLVMENHSLQMMVLCATQVFCHNLNFPKGAPPHHTTFQPCSSTRTITDPSHPLSHTHLSQSHRSRSAFVCMLVRHGCCGGGGVYDVEG